MKVLQQGLSLVELMISLAIGSMITVGIVQLFNANNETYSVMLGQSRMQESARFALDFIGRDIHKAGYRGCFSNNQQLYWTIFDPNDLPYEFDLRDGVRGYEATGVGFWNPVLDAIPDNTEGFVANTGIDKASIVGGTDVLTLRGLVIQDKENRLAVDMPTSREDIQLVAPADGVAGLGFNELDLAVIHDCEKATIFHVTDINTTTNAPNITLAHSLDPTDLWRNSFETLAIRNSFESDAIVSGIETNTYFIAPGVGENNVGDTPLSLWRKTGTSVPIELVEGIEDLQILYGISDDGDDTPNRYVQANEVTFWEEVTVVRVTVVANTVDDVDGAMTPTHTCAIQTCYAGEPTNGIDGLIRRSFTQTFKLRNAS